MEKSNLYPIRCHESSLRSYNKKHILCFFVCLFQQPSMCSSLLLLFSLPAHSNSDMNCFLFMLRFSPHFAHILSWFCPYFAQVLPRFCLGFVQVAWQTQLTILSNEGARSYCVHLAIKRCMKPGTEHLKSMTMAFCCNQMQLWRESDQNWVRMQFWTKMKTRPYQEKPNSCWVFTGFYPSPMAKAQHML